MRARMMLHLSLMVSIALWMGCSKHPSDEQIQKDIQTKAAADPATNNSDVTVTSKEGKVTLTGKVKDDAAGKEYQKIAKEEAGVSDVDDQTSIDPNVTPEPMAATRAPAAEPPPPPPPPKPVVVPAGTVLTVRVGQALGSKTSQTGQTFLATLAQPISAGEKQALPSGATCSGTVVTAKSKGKVKGEGQLDLTLTSISVGGHTYRIHTETLSSTVKGKGKRTAGTTAGGAAGGALIGGLAGGGKGAGIGALVGAGAGFIGGTFTGNKQIEIPAETPLSFTLTEPLTLQP